ncbi:hypothetical protein ATCC90586_009468 [Pythium insidiosum]|nr:hypothetical protein ATCC90586_009468 [Pythium insidiosum]
MGVATTAYTATVSMKKPKTIKRDDDDLQLGPKERKVMRLTDPSPEDDCAMFDDIATTNQETEVPCPRSQIGRVTEDAMEHVMSFLSARDRMAVMSTQRSFMKESLATSDYSSFCRHCEECEEHRQHLCKSGDNHRSSSFWKALFKHSGPSGLKVLRLAGYAVIACPTLRRLNLRYCHKVDDALVRVIAGHLPLLRELNIRYCYKVSDAGVDAITQQLLNLEVLNLSQCNKITDMSITHIVARLKKLKELRLWGCSKLTTSSVVAISEGLPSLALVDIRSQDKVKAVIGAV